MKNMNKVLLAMAALAAELLLLAIIGPLRIDKKISCTFLKDPRDDQSLQLEIAGQNILLVDLNATAEQGEWNSSQCENRLIFVYNLPPKFNAELLHSCATLNPWRSMCSSLSNSGLGPPLRISPPRSSSSSLSWLWRRIAGSPLPNSKSVRTAQQWPAEGAWHDTDQFSGEIIFHSRMLKHRCRTRDPGKASAFFVPFYAGLDVSRHLWTSRMIQASPASTLDSLGEQLLRWLEEQPHFVRSGGADHFLMAGRISWDFRRLPHAIHDWGSSLFHRSQLENVTRLVIERNPWDEADVGIPYPTSFHPRTDSDMAEWISFVRSSTRNSLFAFAGSPRPGYNADFRQLLLDQCRASPRGAFLECTGDATACSRDPLRVSKLFLSSMFCLQPRGDSFTRKSIFDALIAGCIPVFFWNQSAYWQYQLYLPQDSDAYSVFIPHKSVRNGTLIAEVLEQIPESRIAVMQQNVLKIIPGIVYAATSSSERHFADAFDIAIEGAVRKITAARQGGQ